MSIASAALFLILAIVGPPIVAWVRQKRMDLLSAPAVFALIMLGGYVFPLPSVLDDTNLFFAMFPGRLSRPEASLAKALVIAALGALAFYSGYFILGRLSVGGVARRAPLRWNDRMLKLMSVLYAAAGLGFFAVAVMMIGGPSVLLSGLGDRIRLTAGLNYLFQAINILLVVLIVWWVRALNERKAPGKVFWILTAIALGLNALQGSKSVLFIFIAWMALLYHRMRRPISNLTIAAGAVVVFLLLGTYALVLREYFAVGQFVTVTSITPEGVWLLVRRELEGNFIQLQTLTVLVDRMPDDLSFQMGRTFLATLTLVIPRGLWPDKPLPSTGVFTIAFWPDSWQEAGTSLPPGLIGEMYLNLGVAGVVIGLALFGTIIRRAELVGFGPRRRIAGACTATLLVAAIPHYVRGDFAVTVIILILLVPLLVLLRFASRQRTVRTAEQPALAPQS